MPVEEKNGEIRVSAPLTEDDVAKLRAGQHVRFYGTIYTSRDAAHRKMLQAADKGEPLLFDLKGQIIYVGPTPPARARDRRLGRRRRCG
jgi:fumarate hydratase subunit beta